MNFNKKELKWIERLQKILSSQPKTITGFCTGINIEFYKGEIPFDNEGAAVGNIKTERVNSINWEAGAY